MAELLFTKWLSPFINPGLIYGVPGRVIQWVCSTMGSILQFVDRLSLSFWIHAREHFDTAEDVALPSRNVDCQNMIDHNKNMFNHAI